MQRSVEYSEEWQGELGAIGAHSLEHVKLEMRETGYRCQCRVRHADGAIHSYLLQG